MILKKFEKIGDVFLKWYVEPEYRKNYEKYEGERWKGALLFFTNYIFERQGRPADWKEITRDILIEKLKEIKSLGKVDIKKLEKSIWEDFKQKWKEIKVIDDKSNKKEIDIERNKGFNTGRNPLAPPDKYYDKKGEHQITSRSLIKFVAEELAEYNYDIISFAKTYLEKGKIGEAYKKLYPGDREKRINGVGKKIVTMFLRDIFVLSKINPSVVSNGREYLQPIDTWVKRCCKYLNEFENGTTDVKEGYEEFILKICEKYGNINPEKVNMGMWLFASQIVGNHYELFKIFRDENKEKNIVENMDNKIKENIRWLKNGEEFLKNLKVVE